MFTINLTGNSSDRLMPANRIHKTAIVDEESLLASDTRIGSHTRLIGAVRTEANVFIDCNTVIYGPVTLGSGTYLAPNCVIGFPDSSELIKFSRTEKLPTRKRTIIGKDCVIRSGTTIYSNVHI